MSETPKPRKTIRRIAAVLAGLLAVIILSLGTDVIMHTTGIFPPWGQPMAGSLFVIATVYRTIYGVVGGYIAARLAHERPVAHAVVLGVVGLALSLIGAVATSNQGPDFGPRWYPLALVVIALPSSWLGGKLRVRRLRTYATG